MCVHLYLYVLLWGEIAKKDPGKWVEAVWARDEKTGALRRRKEESTTEKEERNGLREVSWTD